MKTITVQIGNSDDKLSQARWVQLVQRVSGVLNSYCETTHFFGASMPFATWQNACWVVECPSIEIVDLKNALAGVGKQFEQNAIAWTEGETVML